MSQFLYFIPGAARQWIPRAEVAATFAASALRDLLRSDKTWSGDAAVFTACIGGGPGGQVGTVFAHLPGGMAIEGFDVDYRADRQTWVKIDSAWLGWYTDNPPTEQSLRRPQTVPGYHVTLNDGCEWMAPIIRCFPPGSKITLPQAVGLGSNGQRTLSVMPFYQRWMELAERLWNHRFNSDMDAIQLIDAAADLLSLNYRVGPREVDALGLFEVIGKDSDRFPNWNDIIVASYDWPLVEELMAQEALKKKESVPEP